MGMKSKIKNIIAIITVIAGYAAVLNIAPPWNYIVGIILTILVALILFSDKIMERLKPQQIPDQITAVSDDLPYIATAATAEDIRWAATVARKVYKGVDIIPENTMLDWFMAYPNGFIVVKNRKGQNCGNLDMFPLKNNTLHHFLKGNLIEQDMTHEDISPRYDCSSAIYVESIVVYINGKTGNHNAVLALMTKSRELFKAMRESGKIKTIYALGASKGGIKLMTRLGFTNMQNGSNRKDEHDMYYVALDTLIENLDQYIEREMTKTRVQVQRG
ncbi:MAG: hypothetical protein ABSA18_09890 [Dehalococcoidia bacterium]|jgi:hypothetical protein